MLAGAPGWCTRRLRWLMGQVVLQVLVGYVSSGSVVDLDAVKAAAGRVYRLHGAVGVGGG